MNGTVCLLQRSQDLLFPSPDRPLSRNRDALEALYARRLPYYRAAADFTTNNDGTLESTVEKLLGYVDQRQ